MQRTLTLIVSLLIFSIINAQNNNGRISGKIIDNATNEPIDYATIAVFTTNNVLQTGGITSTNGEFEIGGLPYGYYIVEISFIGYSTIKLENISISQANSHENLGDIKLSPETRALDEVVIESSQNRVEYQIDKKVVAVSKELTSASMSAVEVLENVPSVRVDIDGNILLRGSANFRVLIDGKPSVLDANDILHQTPASTIQNIEIITNPSVKYAPDGTGGIINIITKKSKMKGVTGLVNASAGRFGQYGGDFLLNYRVKQFNFFLGGEYGRYPAPGNVNNERRTSVNDTITSISMNGEEENIRNENNWKAGFEWDISPNDNLSIEGNIGRFSVETNSTLNYLTTNNVSDEQIAEINGNDGSRSDEYNAFSLNYRHKFPQEQHVLNFMSSYSRNDGPEYANNYLIDASRQITSGSRYIEEGPEQYLELRFDYTKPIHEKMLLETGVQYRSTNANDRIQYYTYQPVEEDFVLDSGFDNNIIFDNQISSLYFLLQGENRKLGYQLGLRGEYSYRNVNAVSVNESFTINKWDIFPTIHLSYKLKNENQLMASYSHRINRPEDWCLEPYMNRTDILNYRQGNPGLQPEYIDALELGFVRERDKVQFSVESYYRIKHDKIEIIQSVYQDNALLNTFQNVGTDYSFGIETMYSRPVWKWWEFSFTGDVFHYRLDSERDDEPYTIESIAWSSRISNTFSLYKKIKIQFDGNYNSPTESSQGKTEANYYCNIAVSSDFFDRRLTTTLQVRDIFGTSRYTSITEDNSFYNYQSNQNHSPLVTVSLSYKINNFKKLYNRIKPQHFLD